MIYYIVEVLKIKKKKLYQRMNKKKIICICNVRCDQLKMLRCLIPVLCNMLCKTNIKVYNRKQFLNEFKANSIHENLDNKNKIYLLRFRHLRSCQKHTFQETTDIN